MDPKTTPAPKAATTTEIIENWFVEHFHREPIATNTEHFNHVRRAVDVLKTRISKEG